GETPRRTTTAQGIITRAQVTRTREARAAAVRNSQTHLAEPSRKPRWISPANTNATAKCSDSCMVAGSQRRHGQKVAQRTSAVASRGVSGRQQPNQTATPAVRTRALKNGPDVRRQPMSFARLPYTTGNPGPCGPK